MEHLSTLFKALSEPLRLRLVALLLEREELCVCDLVTVLGTSQSMVSRHLAYLRNAGWVESHRNGLWMFYRLKRNGDPFQQRLAALLADQLAQEPEALADRERLRTLPASDTEGVQVRCGTPGGDPPG